MNRAARRAWILEQRAAGRSLREIGADLGLSGQRVAQIVNPRTYQTMDERYGPGPWPCRLCGKRYRWPGGSRHHLITVHGVPIDQLGQYMPARREATP